MSIQSFQEVLYAAVADAVQISNSTVETIMIPDTAIPARFWYPGRTLKVTLSGKLSCVVTTPGTLTIRARANGASGTLLAASSALALNIIAQTDARVKFEFMLTCRAAAWSATSGSMMTSGEVRLGVAQSVTPGATVPFDPNIPNTGTGVVSSLDLTSAMTLSFTAQFSVATSPTNLLIDQATIEVMN